MRKKTDSERGIALVCRGFVGIVGFEWGLNRQNGLQYVVVEIWS